MLTLPLSAGLNLAQKIKSASEYTLNTVSTCIVSDKIKALAVPTFTSCTSLYLSAFGSMELAQTITENNSSGKCNDTQKKVINSSSAYLNLHGSLLLGSGTLGLMDALRGFGLVSFGSLAQAVGIASSVLFLCANIVAMDENVRLLNELMTTNWSETNINDQELKWMKQSAFWGMLSNMGYIIATASLLYSGATAITILMAVFSCSAGGMKILFDLMNWAGTENLF